MAGNESFVNNTEEEEIKTKDLFATAYFLKFAEGIFTNKQPICNFLSLHSVMNEIRQQ